MEAEGLLGVGEPLHEGLLGEALQGHRGVLLADARHRGDHLGAGGGSARGEGQEHASLAVAEPGQRGLERRHHRALRAPGGRVERLQGIALQPRRQAPGGVAGPEELLGDEPHRQREPADAPGEAVEILVGLSIREGTTSRKWARHVASSQVPSRSGRARRPNPRGG